MAWKLAAVPVSTPLAFVGFPAKYSPVAYLPQASFLALARFAGFSFPGQFYAGRIGGLAFWLAVIVVCLHQTPVVRTGFWVVGLLPMSLHLAGSYSADGMTNALALLFTAVTFRLALDETASSIWLQVGGLATLALLLAATKAAYAPLIALFAIVPVQRLGSKRHWVVAAAAIVGAASVGILGWTLTMADVLSLPHAADTGRSWRTLLTHPLGFARALADTLAGHGYEYLRQTIGVLGWLDTPLPTWVFRVFAMGLVWAVVVRLDDEPRIDFRQRTVAVVVTGGIFVLIHAIEWIQWTPPDTPLIVGYQGRYFLPTLPALLLGLRVGWPIHIRRSVILALTVGAIVALSATDGTLVRRYHHPRLTWKLLPGQIEAIATR